MSATRIGDQRRRDQLLLLCALAMTLLTVLGAAGEGLGPDRMLKANTVKRRTSPSFAKGRHYYALLTLMPPERANPPLQRFDEYVLREQVFVQAFGLTA